MPKKKTPNKTGPKPETVRLSMDWETAVDKALQKKLPAGGWPKPKKKKRKK